MSGRPKAEDTDIDALLDEFTPEAEDLIGCDASEHTYLELMLALTCETAQEVRTWPRVSIERMQIIAFVGLLYLWRRRREAKELARHVDPSS